jgi:hypothetical protein
MEFSITELYILIPKKGTTRGADSYEDCEYPSTQLAGLVADGAPSMVGRNSGVSSLIANDVKIRRITI